MKPYRQDENGMFICEFENCNRKFVSFKALTQHINKSHKGRVQEYYDRFIFEEGDDICRNKECNNITNFENLTYGYKHFCCKKCKDIYTYEQIEKSM